MMKKTICRLLSLFLTLALTCGLCAVFSISASAEGAWDGVTVTRPAGTGTMDDPFLISSVEELAWVSYMTENYEELNALLGTSFASSSVFEGMFFMQTADIDLGEHTFTPIGTMQAEDESVRNAFGGWYIGGDFSIMNAVIAPVENRTLGLEYEEAMAIGYRPAGLFGVLSSSGVVQNVHAKSVSVGVEPLPYVAGVIVGTTYGGGLVLGCTTDENCCAYAEYGAGGIVGVTYGGEMGEVDDEEITDPFEIIEALGATMVGQSINNARVSSCRATGGIVGFGYNTIVSTCINNGAVAHISQTRWSGAGGIMGMPLDLESNQFVAIGNCINSEFASVGAVSAQATGKNNRVAVGGIMGNDDVAYNAEVVYYNCYNLEESFWIEFWDGGNGHQNSKGICAGIAGYARDADRVEGASAPAVGTRTYELCYTVDCSFTVNFYGNYTNLYFCDYNTDTGLFSEYPYSGIISAQLSPSQVTAGIGNPYQAFASCAYGISAAAIAEMDGYQAILLELGLIEHVCAFTYGFYNETYHVGTCDGCGETEMAAHFFDDGEILVQATHTTDGVRQYTCLDCGYAYLEKLPKYTLDHVYTDWVYEDEKHHVGYCSCGEESMSERHVWDDGTEIVKATCNSAGLTAYTCRDCGYTKYEKPMKPAHTWNDGTVAVAATHLSDGIKIYKCATCDEIKIEIIAKIEAHTHSEWEAHNGSQHKKVCDCGDVQYSDHKWNNGTPITQPTAASEGVKLFTCQDCGETRLESIAKLPTENGCNASLKGSLGVLLLAAVAATVVLVKKKKKD